MFNKEFEEKVTAYLHANKPVADMIINKYMDPDGFDSANTLIFAACLAGFAVHQAVKEDGGKFSITNAKSGKYYRSNAVNKYLGTGVYSIVGTIQMYAKLPDEELRDFFYTFDDRIEEKGWAMRDINAQSFYLEIKEFWESIYTEHTRKCCKDTSDYQMFFALLLLRFLDNAVRCGAPRDDLGKIALECSIYMALLDDDTFAPAA